MSGIGISLFSGASGLNGTSAVSSGSSAKTQVSEESSFSDIFSNALEQYQQADNGGDYATLGLLTGNTDDLSSALIETEKAEIALDFTVAIRNKAVDAYKEIMNMQV